MPRLTDHIVPTAQVRLVGRVATLALAAILTVAVTASAGAWELRVWPEFFRPDPFGRVVTADCLPDGSAARLLSSADGTVTLKAARNGYTSFHLVVYDTQGGSFALSARATGEIEVDLFRQWFHRNKDDDKYYPDALIPVKNGQVLSLPDPQMRIEGQKAAAFWVDLWVPKKAQPGTATVRIELTAGGRPVVLPIKVQLLELIVPDENAITADHNCYGVGWMSRYFKQRQDAVEQTGRQFRGSDEFFAAIHATHRLFYEHRGLFHQLGTSHSGTVTDVFAPELTGQGRTKRIKSWDYFDRHYGPLLDGSAFANTRRGPQPIETIYLPTTPHWPANYLYWGQQAYEVEFVRVMGQMEQHFRQKGWTHTTFEMFFNHKKRYKHFGWDGDETRFPKDNVFFKEFGRLLGQAVPPDSPVKFVFRHDASWLMRQQMDALAGVVNFWVCGAGILAFYPEAPALLKGRGDKVWLYGGSVSAFEPTSAVLEKPLKAWMWGLDGYIHWLVTKPADDPWFASDGAATGLIYPGDKFGLDQPLPCVRLKIQRNMLQDLAMLEQMVGKAGPDGSKAVRATVAKLAGDSKPADWWNPDAPIKKLDPWQWSNATLGDAGTKPVYLRKKLDGRWWLAVRDYALAQKLVANKAETK